MTRKMTVGAAAAAFFGTILAASATSGVVWNAETTNHWFTASTSSLSGWTTPIGGGTANVVNNTIVFDTEVSDSLKYDPAADSGPVALVNVQMIVDPNASMPALTGLDSAQAALSVVTNDTNGGLEWIGLTTTNSVLAWVKLSGNTPTVGATYDVQIAVDNHASDSKRIRYAVKPENGATYTILRCDGVSTEGGWLPNPQSAKSSVARVAFAGAGTIKSLVGTNIVETIATVDSTTDSLGYDFTNGTVTAVVSVPSGDYSGKQVRLTVKGLDGATLVPQTKNIEQGATSVELDISSSSLTKGGAYSYTVEILTNGVSCGEVKSGTFIAANWLDGDYWFAAKNDGTITNGTFVGATFNNDKWEVLTNAQFVVEDKRAGNGKLTRVDTSYSFETFIDTESLERLDDAVGGIVAVSNDTSVSWYAFTGVGDSGWQALAGDCTPVANDSYVIRAEFDFASTTPTNRVRYAVLPYGGSDFIPFTLGGNEWIALAAPSNGLSSVGMSGKGSVGSICATLANTAVATNSVGTKFDTLWQALSSKTEGITLLTNATLKPENVTGGKFGPFNKGGFEVFLDKSGLTGTWKFFEKNGVWYMMKPAATYIFF